MLTKNKDYAFNYMFPRDTQSLNLLKQNYGYYNSMLYFEFDRLRNLNAEKHKKQFVGLSQMHTDILTDVRPVYLASCHVGRPIELLF